MVDHELLAGLNPAQQEAVVSEAAPLCILAGAGSGKTRVLTRRIAWRVEQGTALAPHVLALTFTRRAASELGSRLSRLGVREHVAAGTFHAVAYGQLRRLWADRGERPPALLDRKMQLVKSLMPRESRAASVQPADIAGEIEWAKARMVSPSGYEAAAAVAGRRPPVPAAAMATLFERYEHEKAKGHRVDFDDLLILCASALEHDRTFGAAQRWRFRHLFVDELQDVNPLQFRLLEGWRGERSDLCVVGDPNQAIYAWNGADPRYLTGFRARFPSAAVVHLDDNYRSSPQILAVANAVLDSSTTATGDEHAPHRLRAHQSPGPAPTVTSYPTDRQEAVEVARALRRRAGTSAWSQMAVLTRTHAQLLLFEEALRAAKVPYRLRGQGAFLDQPEIRAALSELRRRPPDTLLAAVLPDLREMAEEAAPVGPAGVPVAGAGGERQGHLDGLRRMAQEHLATDPAASVSGFMGWLRAALRGDDAVDSENAVALTTFHAAKGLEWDVVFLAGLEHGLLPISWAEAPEARAEERRLLYVAVTRARVELHASWAEKRTFGPRSLNRQPSPYLDAIQAAVRDLAEGGSGDTWRRWVDDGRARLKAAHGGRCGRPPGMAGANADPEVLEALKTWRARTARATGVPAFVVFHDTTLAAVAEAKPRNRGALLALPGVGPVKAERYGDAVLEVVATSAPGG